MIHSCNAHTYHNRDRFLHHSGFGLSRGGARLGALGASPLHAKHVGGHTLPIPCVALQRSLACAAL